MDQIRTQRLPDTAPQLGRLPLFAGADPLALARAETEARCEDHAAGTMVLDFDCPSTEVRLVLRGGPLRVLLRTTGGREKIVAEIGPGGFFGELAAIAGPAAPPSAGIRALHQVRLCILPGQAFMDLVLASPPVAHRLLAVLAERIRSQNRRLLEYAALTTRHRLCAELLRLARPRPPELGGGLAISPPPGRPELAARIGARHEAVSRELTELVRLGVLAVGPRAIVVADEAALRREVAAGMEAAKRLT
ncbi:Crp/Fnr family transcriptional regulator [Roseicella aquatilis]|uniref:Crp/Fnr family transcriptional regulator n=1 Tax=Roseicella aquatilis TaxID=2527868 RepID=A0A4R4D4T9_9PROT|nr:Crp/Fnr family transcriptional regulator [Roseicella aquatilis]TCZ53412.1 Crp/Fnr family transcriptional regulator [Roseicella aquatilis]